MGDSGVAFRRWLLADLGSRMTNSEMAKSGFYRFSIGTYLFGYNGP